MMRLNEKVAIITGAAGGFGRATALKFAKEGAILSLVDLDKDKLNETEKLVKETVPEVNFLCTVADVSSEEAVKGFIDTIVRSLMLLILFLATLV